jgi:hypothetical protein
VSRAKQKTPEGYVQGSIMEYLSIKQIDHIRMNTGAVKVEGRFIRFGTPGMGDILAFSNTGMPRIPRIFWIECKAPGGKQTADQKAFESWAQAMGHTYILAYSLEDVAVYL